MMDSLTRWRERLALHRIRELNDAVLRAFSDAGGVFRGTPPRVRELIDAAIEAYEADEFKQANNLCERAEYAIAETRTG
jgi:hypothetical protein